MTDLRVIKGTNVICARPAWTCEEADAELHAHVAERIETAKLIRAHVRSIGFWANRGQYDEADRHARALLRLADREVRRCQSSDDGGGEPTVLRVA